LFYGPVSSFVFRFKRLEALQGNCLFVGFLDFWRYFSTTLYMDPSLRQFRVRTLAVKGFFWFKSDSIGPKGLNVPWKISVLEF